MTSTADAKKGGADPQGSGARRRDARPGRGGHGQHVISEFYEHVPPADVAERSPRNLFGAALSLWRFAERRRPGQAKIIVGA